MPLLLYGDGSLDTPRAEDPALPLGRGELGPWPDRAQEVPFPGGATLLFYTDGVTDARDRHGVFFDPAQCLAGRTFHGLRALLATLVEEVVRHTGVAVRRTTWRCWPPGGREKAISPEPLYHLQ